MTRRATTLVVALVVLAGLFVAARFITVPYVILLPGPVTDTLGNVPAGDTTTGQPGGPVISITGTKTQTSSGHLYLTTVEEQPGSCSVHPALTDAVRAWFNSTETVEPYQIACPPGKTDQQVQQQAQSQMTESQVHAVVAAMRELGYTSTGTRVVVQTVDKSLPAAKALQHGDVISQVNGKPIVVDTQLTDAIQGTTAGAAVALTIIRNGTTSIVNITPVAGPGAKPRIGVSVSDIPTFNHHIAVSIGIDPDVIGGPSAGTALALGIIDKLTPGGLTGGRTIAGTGTVSEAGKVGPIGGIGQKIAAAAKAHATVFFAPADECADAKAAAPSSLTLVAIKTLHDAVTSLQAIKAGSTAFPHC
jgi:PDZ domain-containing protein